MPVFLVVLIFSCGSTRKGALVFRVNGEDFVRDGFIDKGGWHITFDTLLVNLAQISAYNSKQGLSCPIDGEHCINLAVKGENDPCPKVAVAADVKPGNYQSLRFNLKRLGSGQYEGLSGKRQ